MCTSGHPDQSDQMELMNNDQKANFKMSKMAENAQFWSP